MMRLDHVKVCYQDRVALNMGCAIDIKEGDKIGVIGGNGAGKTTLMKSILGIVPYQGKITCPIETTEIAVHMQQNEYSSLVSVQIIMETVLGEKLGDHKKAQELIDFFEFRDCLKKRWKQLSGGQKQRLTLILVMCQESPLTLLDEVSSGLDFETRQKLMEKLEEWFRKRETTLFITSHYYEELDHLADKILFLEEGHVIDFGTREELFHKYCGASVLIAEEKAEIEFLKDKYPVLSGKPGTMVFRCENRDMEKEIIEEFLYHNINYRRSNKDIEIMTMNAKKKYYEEVEEHEK